MSKPIDTLMNEHRVIEGVLDALESFAGGLEEGNDQDRQTAREFARFFRIFADRCHHGKEEDLLFNELTEMGMPGESGPIGVMRREHELGRDCVRRIASVADGNGAWTPKELAQFRGAVAEYVPLLRAHIQKEDNVLFPAAEGLLEGDRVDRLNSQFELFDRDHIGQDVHSELIELAKSLSDRWSA